MRKVIGILGLIVGFLPAGTAFAQSGDFFKTTPGPLALEHAEWDNEEGCDSCHNGGKATSNSKCLGCHDHKDLKKRFDAGKGYHATPKVKGKNCATCHVDHKGRSFNIMGWRAVSGGEEGFDHALAGWTLKAKHAVLECKDCHKQKNKAGRRVYLGEDKLCGNCHKEDQPHGFDRRGMMKCERCHNEVAWKPPLRRLDFDHNNKSDAEFPQEGAHNDVSCGKCHPKARFNLRFKKPGDCRNCHDSSHGGHLFDVKACSWCHSPKLKSLEKFDFKHNTRTRFKLKGKHATVGCYDCHTKSLAKRKPKKSCESCHARENPHRDRFKKFGKPSQCGVCHTASSWSPNQFKGNHGGYTGFSLEGKHARTRCRNCHRGKKPYEWERLTETRKGELCMSCHAHETVHNKKFTDIVDVTRRPKDPKGEPKRYCLECHKTSGVIDVPLNEIPEHRPDGSFPLVDGHAGVTCEGCHPNGDFDDTPTECGARCHEDSLHEGRLGSECSRCHSPGEPNFAGERFDHTEDTEYPLIGLHLTVPTCQECHPGRVYKDTPKNCSAVGCHAKDDAHRGALGPKCEECHLETQENIFDHNAQSVFKLDGAHLTTRCNDCHPSIEFKPVPKTCFGGGACHPEPEVHKGQYGTICEDCHNTTSFAQIQPLHDVGAFSLKGSHDRVACVDCHRDNRSLRGSGNLCINCHRQDDVHSNSLSPRCGDCHTQWSFAPAQFDHTTVGCNLVGLHRTLPCRDCHKSGNFGATIPTCFGCHADIALQKGVNGTDHTGFTTCANCHNTNAWLPATAYGRESICR